MWAHPWTRWCREGFWKQLPGTAGSEDCQPDASSVELSLHGSAENWRPCVYSVFEKLKQTSRGRCKMAREVSSRATQGLQNQEYIPRTEGFEAAPCGEIGKNT